LTFVRPFSEALNHQVNQLDNERPKTTSFIFVTSSGAPVQADLLTAVMKKHSERDCKATLTVASYRQVVLAIAKRYIAIMAQPFNAQRPEHVNKVWKDIAWKAAHNVRTLTNIYALDQSYPSQLQPELIRRYEALSEQWHRWLQVDRLGQMPRKPPQPVPAQVAPNQLAGPVPGLAPKQAPAQVAEPVPGPAPKPAPAQVAQVALNQLVGPVPGPVSGPVPRPVPRPKLRPKLMPVPVPVLVPTSALDLELDLGPDLHLGPVSEPILRSTLRSNSGSNLGRISESHLHLGLVSGPTSEPTSGSLSKPTSELILRRISGLHLHSGSVLEPTSGPTSETHMNTEMQVRVRPMHGKKVSQIDKLCIQK
jgi:hypothetical protein